MNPNELKRLILLNKIPHLLVFSGKETYVKQFYLDKISNKYIVIDNADNLLNVGGNTLFDITSYYKVVDLDILKKESLWNKIKNNFINSQNYCIILLNDLDEKSKFHKEFEKYIVEFNYLSRDLLYEEFKTKGKTTLNDKNFWDLVNICDCDYTTMLIELNKLQNYSKSMNLSEDIAYDLLLKDNVIIRPVGDIVFDLVKAICYGDTNNTNRLYYDIKQTDENYLTILALLYQQFMSMYLIMSCKNNAELESQLGMTPQQIYAIKKNVLGGYTLQEVERNLKCIQYCESKSKIGEIDTENVLDYCISNLMR